MTLRSTTSDKVLMQRKEPLTALRWVKQNALLISIVTAVALGFAAGILLKIWAKPSTWTIWLIEFPGNLMLSMLKCVILPLIISSLVSGIAQLDVRHLGRIGGLAICYYMATTIIATITGIILVVTIHPGSAELYEKYKTLKREPRKVGTDFVSTPDAMMDVLRNIFPDNIVQATMQTVKTAKAVTNTTSFDKELGLNVTKSIETYGLKYANGTNIMGIIVFFLAFGVALSQLGDKAKTMVEFFAILDKISMTLIGWIMWYTPIGVFFLITANLLKANDLVVMLEIIAWYLMTVLIGIAFHFCVTLPLIYYGLTRKNPLLFLKGMLPAMATAFGTASSSATLPISLHCLEEDLNIDSRVTRFILPLGATINMDGTALYEAVAAIFIAQLRLPKGTTSLPANQVLMISVTATLASIGAAAIPQGGIIAMVMVLSSIGLPTDEIALMLTVDWLLDRFQTMVNVCGDAYGASIVHHFCAHDLDKMEKKATVSAESSGAGSGDNIDLEQEANNASGNTRDTTAELVPIDAGHGSPTWETLESVPFADEQGTSTMPPWEKTETVPDEQESRTMPPMPSAMSSVPE